MIISNITPPQVWSASSRSLTNIGSGALASTSILTTTLAASGSVDFRTSAGIVGQATVAVLTGAAATAAISLRVLDATNGYQVATTTAGANASAGFTYFNTNPVGAQIVNLDAANAGSYKVASFVWTI